MRYDWNVQDEVHVYKFFTTRVTKNSKVIKIIKKFTRYFFVVVVCIYKILFI